MNKSIDLEKRVMSFYGYEGIIEPSFIDTSKYFDLEPLPVADSDKNTRFLAENNLIHDDKEEKLDKFLNVCKQVINSDIFEGVWLVPHEIKLNGAKDSIFIFSFKSKVGVKILKKKFLY